jgi:hypothetical protein
VRLLDGFGVAERVGELHASAVEVKRLAFGPQPRDDRACLCEGVDGLAEIDVGQAVGVVLAAGPGKTRPGAGANAELEPPRGHDVYRRCNLGQHGWRPEPIAGDQQAQA